MDTALSSVVEDMAVAVVAAEEEESSRLQDETVADALDSAWPRLCLYCWSCFMMVCKVECHPLRNPSYDALLHCGSLCSIQ